MPIASFIYRNRLIPVAFLLLFALAICLKSFDLAFGAEVSLQYEADGIAIQAASEEEPRVAAFGRESIMSAVKYLDDGAKAWVESNSCVACHTTGVYMAERPALTPWLGKPPTIALENFLTDAPSTPIGLLDPTRRTKYEGDSITPVWRTLGLANWDRHVRGELSKQTDVSLRDMLNRQHHQTGLWPTYQDIEIPYIMTDFDLSVHGAQAIATAPGWLASLTDATVVAQVEKLKQALKSHAPRNDYEIALKLQLASFWPELVSDQERSQAVQMLWSKQHDDGGWSTRQMSEPTNWRDEVPDHIVELLQQRPEESDPYMTAFAIILLRGEGVPADDPRIQNAVAWLKREQRVSGRWWARTMLRPSYHFITYISTAKALSALAACGELDLLKQEATLSSTQ